MIAFCDKGSRECMLALSKMKAKATSLNKTKQGAHYPTRGQGSAAGSQTLLLSCEQTMFCDALLTWLNKCEVTLWSEDRDASDKIVLVFEAVAKAIWYSYVLLLLLPYLLVHACMLYILLISACI